MDFRPSASVQLTDATRLDWLRLIRSENVGPRTFRSLINHFGSARLALEKLPEMARRGGAPKSARICTIEEAERELSICARMNIHLLAPTEHGYPARLANIDDPPPLLGVRGNRDACARPMIAIVGSRNASAAGIRFAERIAHDLGAAGFVIASGLARGIDHAAHRASIASGTLAVLAGGHDRIYPSEHAGMLEALLANGAAVSEMPIGHQPRARDFPRRNRIVSGVAFGVLIVEAAHRSGSLITARMAAEQGRDVFAVPGSPLDPRAAGTNDLIKNGAALVTCADDIIHSVKPAMERPVMFPSEEPEARDQYAEPDQNERAMVLSLLGPSPVSIDDLIRLAGTSAGIVRTVLLELELAGRLERHGGGLVSISLND